MITIYEIAEFAGVSYSLNPPQGRLYEAHDVDFTEAELREYADEADYNKQLFLKLLVEDHKIKVKKAVFTLFVEEIIRRSEGNDDDML